MERGASAAAKRKGGGVRRICCKKEKGEKSCRQPVGEGNSGGGQIRSLEGGVSRERGPGLGLKEEATANNVDEEKREGKE